ncbi:hypothetical protein TOT_040000755 [Theileria orientalis strain Shintoku]|uniref:Uncharacterized protein n=1 Tax=Theileria orientalis strain Shintoku TaxID=869250 RepID=J7M8K9_THEOR|nr:hypothetical protein TOT_040000755 [Theileria orientalis strain Shintoku]PVC52629.1 hypothetical protein MACL_00000625 [Theileria orientalis]BAM42388.1 hypothetical protein TOT_040000755 [Theileria orientalis strain Shintoku]|eukprot:XP_009692689.1 hypothetical protein TOT_040000755 [Theileria orientalis strain Shintoku]
MLYGLDPSLYLCLHCRGQSTYQSILYGRKRADSEQYLRLLSTYALSSVIYLNDNASD